MKRNFVLRNFALILVVALLISLFTGCKENNSQNNNNEKANTTNNSSNNNKEEKNTTDNSKEAKEENNNQNANEEVAQEFSMPLDEPVTITFLMCTGAAYPYREDWLILEEIKKRTNVSFDPILVPSSDFATKRQIIINSGEIPDIVTHTHAADISDYALSGLFLPINQYEDIMPNYKSFLEENNYEKELDSIRENDGNYYGFPVKASSQKVQLKQWMARLDLLEKHDLEVPKTLDDVYEVCKTLKSIYPDSFPIINRFGSGNILSTIAPGFGVNAGWGLGNSGFMYDEASDEWIFAPTTENYKEMLQFMNKLLVEDILDKEFTTLDMTGYEEKAMNGETFIFVDWFGNQIRYNKEGTKTNPDFNVQPIMPVTGPNGDYCVGTGNKFEQSWVIASSVKDKPYFDSFIKFLDWMYTNEAGILMTFGVEGKTYNVIDGKLDYVEDIKNGTIDRSKEYGLDNNELNVRRHVDYFASILGAAAGEVFAKETELNIIKDAEPKLLLSQDEKETQQIYATELNDYINQMTEKFIYGKESFDNWDKFVEQCEQKGSIDLGKLYNKVWENQN